MKLSLKKDLFNHRAEIRGRWMELLLVEPVNSPLAEPRAMIFMLDETLERVFIAIRRGEVPRAVTKPGCSCGLNPFLAYFRAGIQALHETLILIQARDPSLKPADRDAAFAELDSIIRRIASTEIATFASLCQHRDHADETLEPAGSK
jgi:hypothetical protein